MSLILLEKNPGKMSKTYRHEKSDWEGKPSLNTKKRRRENRRLSTTDQYEDDVIDYDDLEMEELDAEPVYPKKFTSRQK